jgi:hypothetical protein
MGPATETGLAPLAAAAPADGLGFASVERWTLYDAGEELRVLGTDPGGNVEAEMAMGETTDGLVAIDVALPLSYEGARIVLQPDGTPAYADALTPDVMAALQSISRATVLGTEGEACPACAGSVRLSGIWNLVTTCASMALFSFPCSLSLDEFSEECEAAYGLASDCMSGVADWYDGPWHYRRVTGAFVYSTNPDYYLSCLSPASQSRVTLGLSRLGPSDVVEIRTEDGSASPPLQSIGRTLGTLGKSFTSAPVAANHLHITLRNPSPGSRVAITAIGCLENRR